MEKGTTKAGFTLVEIAVTTAIVGLLASLAVPQMLKSGVNARNRRFASDIRAAGHAFVQYAMFNGDYPADKNPGQMPDGMEEYLAKIGWQEPTAIGGQWDWDYKVFGVHAAVSVKSPQWDLANMAAIDKIIDDGNLETGQFRARTGGFMYVLEEL
jgi:prepilin-type N-terminal cleavage/methylation domain-containing protein